MPERQPVFRNSRVEKIVPEFCVDTNILLQLYAFYINNIPEIIDITNQKRYTNNYCVKLLQMLREKKIKLYVPSDALIEFFGYKKRRDFLRKKAFLEDLGFKRVSFMHAPKSEMISFYSKKRTLFEKYCGMFPEEGIKALTENPKIHIDNPKLLQRPVFFPTSKIDAKIMAESSILGIPLITLDRDHFLKGHHPEMIVYLNKNTKGASSFSTTRPISPSMVFTMLNQGRYPALYKKMHKVMYDKSYPLESFAFCRKQVLSHSIRKHNKKQLEKELDMK